MFDVRPLKLLAAVALGASLVHGAQATVLVTGSGTWDATASSSIFSAPNAAWSFSFVLPDVVDTNPTSTFSAFSYALSGTTVDAHATAIGFYTSSDSGMFDIDFGTQAISFYGPAVLANRSLLIGRYNVFAGLDSGLPSGSGSIALAIPEPGTWLLLTAGLSVIVGLKARRQAG